MLGVEAFHSPWPLTLLPEAALWWRRFLARLLGLHGLVLTLLLAPGPGFVNIRSHFPV